MWLVKQKGLHEQILKGEASLSLQYTLAKIQYENT